MTRQKAFKSQVRGRMAKTGERYTAARARLLQRAPGDHTPRSADSKAVATGGQVPGPEAEMPVADDRLRGATGRGWDEWLAALDDWGAARRTHTEIARWLVDEQQVGGWWAQSVALGYERARGRRTKHQTVAGFSVSVNRTVVAPAEEVVSAVTEPVRREAWLPDADMRPRPTRAAGTARFDWLVDGSRVAVYVVQKGADRTQVSVVHERLADSHAAERMKEYWRERLGALKELLESAL